MKQRQHVKVQQAEAEVKQAKDKAKVMAHKDVSKAISLLTLVRDGISTDPDLPDATRKVLLRSLDIAISGYRARVADLASLPIPTAPIRTINKKPLDEDTPRLRLGHAGDQSGQGRPGSHRGIEGSARRELPPRSR